MPDITVDIAMEGIRDGIAGGITGDIHGGIVEDFRGGIGKLAWTSATRRWLIVFCVGFSWIK